MELIRGHGQQSEIMVVADYSDQNDLSTGMALSNKPGKLVSQYLKGVGVPGGLDYCYATSYIKMAVQGANTRNKKKRKEILAAAVQAENWEEILKQEVETIRPNVIIALGELALNILAKEKGINNFRGSILPPNPFWKLDFTPKVIPTLHPRQIYENWLANAYVPNDYKRAWDLRYLKGPHKRNELLWICRSAKELFNYFQRIRNCEYLVFDIETFLNFITCIGFCHDGYEAVSVPLMEGVDPIEMHQLFLIIHEILGSKLKKVNQNLKFDAHECDYYFGRVENLYDDTMLLFHHLYPELPKNLGFQTSLYTEQPYYKDEGSGFDPRMGLDQLYYYNAKDCLVTWQIYKKQVEEAKELKVWGFHRQNFWDNGLYIIYKKSEERGIRVDMQRHASLTRKYEMMFNGHVYNLQQEYGKEFNVLSWQQVGKFLYEYLECPKMTHFTEKGEEVGNTDAESLEELYLNRLTDSKRKRLVKEIIVSRKIHTVLGFLKRIISPDGRFRSTTRLEGTKSGRTSDSTYYDSYYAIDDLGELGKKGKLHRFEYGGTLKNIPKRPYECEEFEGEVYGTDIPSIFIPSPGYCFVEGDGKSAEAGVVFVLAEDWEMLDFMYNRKTTKKNDFGIKDDIHTMTAMMCKDMKFEQITKFIRETFGKRARHAGHFDMGEYRLMFMIHRPLGECRSALQKFHQHNPKIRLVFHGDIRRFVENNNFLVSPHGRRRDFFGRRNNKQFWKEVYSHLSQATVSDHTKFSMPLLLEQHPSAEFLIEKHDSLLCEVLLTEKERYCNSFKQVYERPINFRNCSISRNYELVIPAEIKCGGTETSWGDLEEWEG